MKIERIDPRFSAPRYHERRRSEPTLEWHALPVLGADRELRTRRLWARIAIGAMAFWLGVALIVAALVR